MTVAQSKRLSWAAGIGLLMLGGVLAWQIKPAPPPSAPSLATLENMGHLVSMRVHVADVIEYTLPRAVDIPGTDYEIRYAGTNVVVIAKGDCSLASDLRLAKQEDVDAGQRRFTLVLQTPIVLGATVNHAAPEQGGSRVYRIENEKLEMFIPERTNMTKAVEGAFDIAQKKVAAACAAPDVVAQAKKNTEDLLRELYKAAGWDIAFKWVRIS
jgi:hypothetical protein